MVRELKRGYKVARIHVTLYVAIFKNIDCDYQTKFQSVVSEDANVLLLLGCLVVDHFL